MNSNKKLNTIEQKFVKLQEEFERVCYERDDLRERIAKTERATTPSSERRRRVVIESPLAGDRDVNKQYARACMLDSLKRGEAPYASHLLFDQPGLLDDDNPDERELGITAGLDWGEAADATVVYTDLGISSGMQRGIERAQQANRPIEYRTIEWKRSSAHETCAGCSKLAQKNYELMVLLHELTGVSADAIRATAKSRAMNWKP